MPKSIAIVAGQFHQELMDKIKADMQNVGKVELQPKFDGKQMIMVIQPL